MVRRPPGPLLFPYTTLFRSQLHPREQEVRKRLRVADRVEQRVADVRVQITEPRKRVGRIHHAGPEREPLHPVPLALPGDRKSTRLNSSHTVISYAAFFL